MIVSSHMLLASLEFPFQPSQIPPISRKASRTPTTKPPAELLPSVIDATRFDTTISLLMAVPPVYWSSVVVVNIISK